MKREINQEFNSCEVCQSTSHKYKCPSCNIKYCSLSCFKTHKDGSCERKASRIKEGKQELERTTKAESNLKEVSETEEGEITCSSTDEESEDADRVGGHLLEKLGHSKDLLGMLHNKHLREMMKEIDSSQDPGKLLSRAMQIPIFTEFVDECLHIVEPQDDESKMDL